MWLRILAGALLNCTRTPHMKELYAAIDDHIQQYEEDTVTISDESSFRCARRSSEAIAISLCPEGGFGSAPMRQPLRRPQSDL